MMWEVNPESKSKLLALQKRPGNDRCCDCGAPSPQWASPKFGTFICLTCAGLHRGLGVHISFVRSITMDAFKGTEMARMEMGGNDAWKVFWEANEKANLWDEVGLQEKYGGAVGEEYKERLSCKVEGKEFTGMPQKVEPSRKNVNSVDSGDRLGRRTGSPAAAQGRMDSRKDQNEAYFARMGKANASRSADLPPSQGGKYGGFGSEPSVHSDIGGTGRESNDQGIPGVDDFQKDPVAALTKGFGWFTTTVGKGAKTVNEGWIQPAAQKIASADLPTQARLTAASVAQNITSGTKGAAEQLNRFIDEGVSGDSTSSRSRGGPSRTVEPERRDFWDSFGTPAEDEKKAPKPSAIGTSAVRKKDEGSTGVKSKNEGWEEW